MPYTVLGTKCNRGINSNGIKKDTILVLFVALHFSITKKQTTTYIEYS